MTDTTPTIHLLALVERELSNANDNLARARRAFAGADPSVPYGQSGQTPAAILTGYEQDVARAEAALAWLRAVSP
jgi:hypothetical protein